MREQDLLEQLDRDGYAVVRKIVPAGQIDDLRRWIDELVDADLDWRRREAARRRAAGETDARAFRIGSEGKVGITLNNDDVHLAAVLERVDEVARAIGTPRRGSIGGGACLPGWGGHSGLHQDLPGPAPEAGRWDGAIFTFPLSAWEGMRLVPGSHRRGPVFSDAFAAAVAPHPDELYVDAGPGDVVINSIHIWKSSTLNRSAERRSEIWVAYDDGAETSAKVADHWAHAEIRQGEAPAYFGNAVKE